MQKVLTADTMREVDRLTTEKYGISSIFLMENAAHAIAHAITEKLGGSVVGKSFLILCGKGNNGGDGAALARILWNQGASVVTYLFGKISETKNEAQRNFEILKNLETNSDQPTIFHQVNTGQSKRSNDDEKLFVFGEVEIEEILNFWTDWENFNNFDFVVDALLGTGLNSPLKHDFQNLVHRVQNLVDYSNNKTRLLSIDIPSGLNADSSQLIGKNFKADSTVTFTAPKLANILPPASNYNGELYIANIGSPQELIDNSPSKIFLTEKSDAQNWLEKTKYTEDSYKNKRGHALLIVGSKEYAGAAVLAGNAAMLSGVGLTTVATSESARELIAAKTLEEIITHGLSDTKNGAVSEKAFEKIEKLFEETDVVGIGCGLSSGEKTTKNFVRKVVEKRQSPVVIDADALNALSPFSLNGSDKFPLILTPHEGEFLRLLGTTDKEIIKDRVKAVREFAEKHSVILVLKGERVLIGAPDGTVVINPTGNSGLGKAGNGDTLTGIITGFIAQAVQMNVDIFETVVAAVYISGTAGDIAAEKFGKRTMLASDVRECLRETFELLEERK